MVAQGFDDLDEAVNSAKERRDRSFSVRRFFMTNGTSRDVIFLDESGYHFYEHGNIKVNGRWQETPCPGQSNGCPFCASGKDPYRIYVFTIIDCCYVDKKGSQHLNQKKVYAIKAEAMKLLYSKFKSWGGLKGKQVRISRSGQQSPNSGNGFELAMSNGAIIQPNFQQLSNGDPTFMQPFNYAEIYRPLPSPQLNNLYQQSLQSSAPTVPTGYASPVPYGPQGYPPPQGYVPPQNYAPTPPQPYAPPMQQQPPQQGFGHNNSYPPPPAPQSGGQPQPAEYRQGLDDIPF